MKRMGKEVEWVNEKLDNLEPPENTNHIYHYATDCHGLVAGDEDVLWLSKKKIWLYECESCHGIYYAYKFASPQRICPYCKHDYNDPLDRYYDLKRAIAEIEDRDPYEHKTIQQIIEGYESARRKESDINGNS